MSKFPIPGKVKTRLISVLGEEGACALHKEMVEHIFSRVNEFAKGRDVRSCLHIAGAGLEEAIDWLGEGDFYLQAEGDLGYKMKVAAEKSFKLGASKVLIVGTDCPALTSGVFGDAITGLDDHDLVMAPAYDGGYVLIGLSGMHGVLFENIEWGTSKVLEQSLSQAKINQLKFCLLDTMSDVDIEEDLEQAYIELRNEK